MRHASTIGPAIVSWLPCTAWACSGPGAMAAIERAERLGWQLFALLLGVSVIATVLLRRWQVGWRRLAAIALLVVVHPGWWLTARGGDCGSMRLMGSIGVTAVGAAALLVALVVTGVRRQRERS